jgi:hypothetical protein
LSLKADGYVTESAPEPKRGFIRIFGADGGHGR